MTFKPNAQSIIGLRFLEPHLVPIRAHPKQHGLNSMQGANDMYRGAKGTVYSLEKCRRHDCSVLSVGAQKPPQMGMLKMMLFTLSTDIVQGAMWWRQSVRAALVAIRNTRGRQLACGYPRSGR
mmetsp:Transcript_68011/g.196948  ORF Transcript_68011/g.196948 Transcript_68011/m.196948 type:complete len:123 (-) Transcript_68011:30-398(-)